MSGTQTETPFDKFDKDKDRTCWTWSKSIIQLEGMIAAYREIADALNQSHYFMIADVINNRCQAIEDYVNAQRTHYDLERHWHSDMHDVSDEVWKSFLEVNMCYQRLIKAEDRCNSLQRLVLPVDVHS